MYIKLNSQYVLNEFTASLSIVYEYIASLSIMYERIASSSIMYACAIIAKLRS